ncbi:membrane-bound lytic murein transglycosylase MltF [Methylococcus sp. EFPC2]|uniref:membrane-bound lytic murein transglycosylase MltF n=1 Tax=Methylococcus sp. EFPC2 TaxID=2812648 RepID=UPI0019671A7A|nr:membrane-bound lytic murein transglycosylase MltF [Methylococcus sp. EFPC2]QSA98042.1 membrane-bound lytic murein transglycosylase MltF [Methylococcus sp. EFPC2]
MLFFLFFLFPLSGCVEKPAKPLSHLQRVKQAGELKIATRYGPTSYYEGPDGYAGIEHDLAQLFAKKLGVTARFIVPDSPRRITHMVEKREVDFAAAGLMVTEARRKNLRFSPSYRSVAEQVVYRANQPQPRFLNDLQEGLLQVAAGGSHLETLKSLRHSHPGLNWSLNYERDVDGLLMLVNEGLLDYTLVQSDMMLRMRRYYPNLRVAFDLGKPRELAWAFSYDEDSSLYREAVRFFEEIRENKQLDQIIDRYYGHSASYDAALDSSLRLHYRQRLPKYKKMFQRAAEQSGLDWRLLAAVAYQESQWDGRAVSAEGVRGMMMLTGDTARDLHVTDLFDPGQSIRGGASYLHDTLAQIPPQIQDPDRTWFALAAYNVGWGHIEDVRELVRERGGDPDKWIDVKAALPLLGKRTWYRKTRHGKARGALAVHYVNSIRRYYDLLVWLTGDEENHRIAISQGNKPREGGA